jgi:quercetin 2,3-dioxygenase
MATQNRKIKKIVKGRAAVDGAGVSLVRVFGRDETREFDPFLLFDAFDSRNPEDYIKGFPWHPHRGIETVTYLIRGNLAHGDSLGNAGKILDGDCQWMTAGSGIIHQEMPQPTERLLGCQLWLNLPAKDKMVDPQYNDILNENVPRIDEDEAHIRIISGTYKGQQGAFEGKYVSPLYLDVHVHPNAAWGLETDPGATLFVYLVQGCGVFDATSKEEVSEKNVVLFKEGDQFWMKAGDQGCRFLLIMGEPLGEPIAWGGPIVMNTREELNQAFTDLEDQTFIRS